MVDFKVLGLIGVGVLALLGLFLGGSVFFNTQYDQNLNKSANVTFSNLFVDNNLFIGGSILNVQSQNITGDLMPSVSNTFRIGNTSLLWANVSSNDAFVKNMLYVNGSVQVGSADVNSLISIAGGRGILGYNTSNNEIFLKGSASKILTLWSNGAERIRIDTSGNVGIGTPNPQSTLDLGGQNPVFRINTSGQAEIQFTGSGQAANILHTNYGFPLYINVQGGDVCLGNSSGGCQLVVKPSGFVGIFKPSPSAMLDVNYSNLSSSGSTGIIVRTPGNYYNGITLINENVTQYAAPSLTWRSNGTDLTIRKDSILRALDFLNSSGFYSARIGTTGASSYFNTDGGNVSIGTFTNGAKLMVRPTFYNANSIMFLNPDGREAFTLLMDGQSDPWVRLYVNTTGVEGARIRADGSSFFINRLGIGNDTPISLLQLVGSAGDNTDLAHLDRYVGGNSAALSTLIIRTAGGTPAVPINVPINGGIGGFGVRAYNGTAFTAGSIAYVYAYALQNISGTGTGTRLDFGVTPNGSTTVGTYMRLTSAELNVSAVRAVLNRVDVLTNLSVSGNMIGTNFYGSMFSVNESGRTLSLPATDVYVNVTGMNGSFVNGVTFSEPYLNVNAPGLYKIDWSVSFSGGASNLYGIAVGKNGERQLPCYTHRTTSSVGLGNTGASCILNLTVNDKITIVIADEASPTNDPSIFMANLAMIRVGAG